MGRTELSKQDQLARDLSAVLDASPLPYADKVQALTLARRALPAPSTGLEDWRRQRAAQGPVGSGKKADAAREALKSKGKGNK